MSDAVRPGSRAGVGGGATYAAAIPVPAPFIYVSAHVVYAKRVCILTLYFVGFSAAVSFIPCNFVYIVASAVGCS